MRLHSVFFFLLLVSTCTSYKILVYNVRYDQSHSNFMGNIADILAEAGHDVTSLVSIIDESIDDATAKSKKIYVPPTDKAKSIHELIKKSKKNDFFALNINNPIINFVAGRLLGWLFVAQCRGLLNETALIDRLTQEHYEVFIAESFDMCGVGLAHILQPKSLITTLSMTPSSLILDELGLPREVSYNPSPYISGIAGSSIWSRIKNIYAEFLTYLLVSPGRRMMDETFRQKFGPDYPTLQQISSNAAYAFVNTEPLVDFATTTLSRIVHVGGLYERKARPLKEYWNEILSMREKSVLISFGTEAKMVYLPKDVKKSLLRAIGDFSDVTFIIRYEDPEDNFAVYARRWKNVILSREPPQTDLLNDARMSAIITHGGLENILEVAKSGVPGIFIPISADHPRNAGMMQRNGLGRVIDKQDMLDSKRLIEVIRNVLDDGSYRENARRLSAMLNNKPISSKEQLIKYTEFAAEFGPSPALRPQSHDMSFIEYHNLDIIIVFVIVIVTFIFGVNKFWRFILSSFRGEKKIKKD